VIAHQPVYTDICTTMIRTIIFDDNADRRDSLGMLIQATAGLELCGSFADANSALKDVEASKPDVVLMDIGMPGTSGIDAARIIRSTFPDVHIIMQTVFDDQERIFEAIKAGASGYILKSTPPQRILEAIHDANEGGSPFTPSIAARVINFFREQVPADNPDYGLSDREKEVLTFLVEGMSYKMIATSMNISYNTVNSHIKKIYDKLHVHSVGEAVSKAIQQKIVG
jgi:DNA-binding NarL/FixJ family response regulator